MRKLDIRFCFAVCVGLLVFLGGAHRGFGDPGDIAIFREAAGTQVVGTSVYTHSFDTTVRSTGTYSLGGSNDAIRLNDTGRYAVIYSSRFDDPGNNGNQRSEVQSWLRLNSTDLPIGWSQCYTRRQQGDFEAITSGGGIISASANDVLRLRSQRTDQGDDTLNREPNTPNMQLIKLNDDWNYLRVSRSSNQNNIGGSWTDVNYNSLEELEAGSFDYTSGTGDVTLKEEGHYLVFANTYLRKSGLTSGSRTAYLQRLTLDDALVDGTLTTVYLRGHVDGDSANDGAAAIGTIIETTGTDQVLRVQVRKETGQNSHIIADRAALTVVKLPDDADYIRLDDSGTDNFNPNSPAALGWDAERERDSYSFGHSDSQITANVAGDYMFLTALYDDNDPNSRIKWWQRWRENGTDFKEWGQTGRYSRNSGNQANGNWSGIMLDLDATDYVEVVSQRLGNSGNLQAVEKGLQGVRLDHLFADTLTWNGTDPADWTSANWLDGPTAPSGEERHVVPSGTVQVTSDLSSTPALSLTINGGEVEVQPAGTLNVLHNVDVAGGTLDVDGQLDAGELNVGPAGAMELSGTLNTGNVRLQGAVETSADIDAAGKLELDGAAITTSGTVTLSGGRFEVTNKPDLDVTGGELTIDGARAPAPAGATVLFTLDDSADLLNDDTGNGYNGSPLGGAPTFSSDARVGDGSARFNGSQGIQPGGVNSIFEDAESVFTAAAWIKLDATSGVQSIFEEGGTTNGIQIWADGDDLKASIMNNKGSPRVDLVEADSLTAGTWHHVAAVFGRQNALFELYLDGTLADSDSFVTTLNAHGSDPGIANTAGGPFVDNPLSGRVDEFYYYDDDALDAAGIADLARGLPRFGDLTMAAGSKLTLFDGIGGTGEASFDAIVAGDGATIDGNVVAAGTLVPGSSIGTVDVLGDLTLLDGAVYEWEFNGLTNDTVEVDVNAQLALPGGGESWTLRLFDEGIFQTVRPEDELVLFSYGTLLGGSVGNWVLDGSNLDWRVDLSNAEIINDAADSQVVLTGMFAVVPEPATLLVWSLLAAMGIGVGWRRRRR